MGAIGSCSKCPKRKKKESTDFSIKNLQFHILKMRFLSNLLKLTWVKLIKQVTT